MQGPKTSTKTFKQAFLKKLILGLQLQGRMRTSFGSDAMSLHERKLAIKSSANAAMVAARRASRTDARWPKAILASAAVSPSSSACKVQRCRRMVSRCCRRKRSWIRSGRASGGDVARRIMVLREVIPGGRDATVNEATLLREAMDYAVHLRAQVDMLRLLSEAVQRSSSCSAAPGGVSSD
ncbi:hypothetical protein CFC21_105277 [Triticum aestivum]|uniref:IBH1-like N-terminal domain-containing protein n=2 Tax=Triticum aestivum TaxID=4565 RepID=A0A3B6SNB3_WHEAT|nr:hypothetical protein CFC21_105277 [Triticum aestivum]